MPTREEKIAARRAAAEVRNDTLQDSGYRSSEAATAAAIAAAIAALPDLLRDSPETGVVCELPDTTDAVLEAIERDPELRKKVLDLIAERSREWLEGWLRENASTGTAPHGFTNHSITTVSVGADGLKVEGIDLNPPPERVKEIKAAVEAHNASLPAPDTLFREWLRSSVGMDVTDHRLPLDGGRLCGVLEDNARKAFFAGMEAAR